MQLQADIGHVESIFFPFGDSVSVFTLDRCMVCARSTIGSEIVLDALDGTTR
jgi:hypothetical protein